MLLKYFLITGAIQALFQILLLRTKNKNQHSDYWLMGWLSLVSVQLFFYFDNLSDDPFSGGIVGIVAFSIPLLSAPILFQYIRSISIGRKLSYKRFFIYIVPWATYLFVTIVTKIYYPSSLQIKSGYPHFSTDIPTFIPYVFTFPMAIIPGIYALLGFTILLRYQKSLPDRYSYTENINLSWLKWLVLSILALFTLLFVFIRFSTQIQLVNANNLFLYVGLTLSLYVFLIGYLGFRHGTRLLSLTTDSTTQEIETDIPYKKSGLDESSVTQLYGRLLAHMETQKPFLRDDLSLSLLAVQLSLKPNQLSQVINQKSGSNFFVFVNTYRVEEVKAKLSDPAFSHLSILGIAYECGFRSKSAFNRIFKEQTGISPLTFQRKNKPL